MLVVEVGKCPTPYTKGRGIVWEGECPGENTSRGGIRPGEMSRFGSSNWHLVRVYRQQGQDGSDD